jgi:hypothetical protein
MPSSNGVPMTWIGPDLGSEQPLYLGEMPRNGSPYTERPLTVDSLAELRALIEGAFQGWRDMVLAVFAESERQKSGEQ